MCVFQQKHYNTVYQCILLESSTESEAKRAILLAKVRLVFLYYSVIISIEPSRTLFSLDCSIKYK